jgi:hypothetical protein
MSPNHQSCIGLSSSVTPVILLVESASSDMRDSLLPVPRLTPGTLCRPVIGFLENLPPLPGPPRESELRFSTSPAPPGSETGLSMGLEGGIGGGGGCCSMLPLEVTGCSGCTGRGQVEVGVGVAGLSATGVLSRLPGTSRDWRAAARRSAKDVGLFTPPGVATGNLVVSGPPVERSRRWRVVGAGLLARLFSLIAFWRASMAARRLLSSELTARGRGFDGLEARPRELDWRLSSPKIASL